MRLGVNTLFIVPDDVGGTEVYLRQTLIRMVRYAPEDIFVLFTTLDNDTSFRQDLEGMDNVEYVKLPFKAAIRPLRILMEQSLLPILACKNRVDSLWSPGYTAPLVCSCPAVVTIHDLQYKSHPDDLSWIERITLDFLVRNSCFRCDRVIAVSEFSRNEILRFGFAESDKVVTIPEGVDPVFGEKVNIDVRRCLNIPTNVPYLLCVAHTYPHKRLHLLAGAFARICDKIPHHLVIVGKARRGEGEFQKELSAIPDKSRFHRLHNLEYAELVGLYQGCEVFVLPSEYEGFGLPVIEALLSGVPVVASGKASIPEVGGEHIDMVSSGTAESFASAILASLKRSTFEKEKRKVDGQNWAKRFTWDRCARETLKIIKTAG